MTSPSYDGYRPNGRSIRLLAVTGSHRLSAGGVFTYDDYSDFGTHFSPRLGLIRVLDNSAALKLLYGHAFKAPTGNQIYGAPLITGNPDLAPEEIDTVELVYIKQRGNSKFEATLFHSDWKNAVIVVGAPPNRTYNNSDNSTSYGLELGYVTQLDDWKVDVNGSYVRSKNKTTGTEFTTFPNYIVNLGVGYQLAPEWSLHLNNRVMLDMSKYGEAVGVANEPISNYWRADFNVTRQYKENWKLYANIRNLFNRNNQYPTGSTGRPSDTIGGIQDEEISLDVGVEYSF